jgi:hypothetical protein
VFVKNHCVEAKYSVVCMFLDRCNSPKTREHMLTTGFTDPAWSGAGGQTARGARSDRPDESRKVWIESNFIH